MNKIKIVQNFVINHSSEIPVDQSFKFHVTIVVATVGESTLENLIKSIEESTLLPLVLILSFPPNSVSDKNYFSEKFSIIKVIADKKGQVYQRCYALNYVHTPLVLQVDADVVFHHRTIEILVDTIMRLGEGNVVSPMIHQNYRLKHFPRKCLESLRCLIIDGSLGIKGTKITKSGIPYFSEDLVCSNDGLVRVEWFHSVRLYHKVDAVYHNYYPFSGKAYLEDVIQALEFRKKNVILWAVPNAFVEHCPVAGDQEPVSDLHVLRAQRWITATYGFSKSRLELYYSVMLLKQIIMKLLRKASL